MKKIFLIAVVATLSLSSCTRNLGEAHIPDEDPGGSYGDGGYDGSDTPAPVDPAPADSTPSEEHPADSLTQPYPIPH